MVINVDKNKVIPESNYIINRGEYKVTPIQFLFTDEYEGLVKKAIFVKKDHDPIEVAILNSVCEIPIEMLNQKEFELRVYAYELEDGELKLRYSPTLTKLYTREGSYIEGGVEPEEITPSQFEQYMQAMNDGLEEVENVDIDAEKINHTATITITNRNGQTKTVTITDGEKGEPGEKGDNTPIKGVDYWTAEDKEEIVAEVLENIQDSEEVYY